MPLDEEVYQRLVDVYNKCGEKRGTYKSNGRFYVQRFEGKRVVT